MLSTSKLDVVPGSTQPGSLGANSRERSTLVPHYLVFELGYTGHYPHYIRHLVEFWMRGCPGGQLTIVVSPQFAQHHPEVIALGQQVQAVGVTFVVISDAQADQLLPRRSAWLRARRSLQEWQLLESYAVQYQATHCLLLYFDSFQTAVLLRRRLPCAFSGIYFRPSLHYLQFEDHRSTRKAWLQTWRERFVLPRVLTHPQLRHLFCLDPFFVDFAHRSLGLSAPIYLPDPVEVLPDLGCDRTQALKQQLGIEAHRTSFLLFGALYDPRKGIHQVLDALAQLPQSLGQTLCLLLVGQLGEHQQNQLRGRLAQLSQSHGIQVVIRDGFVSDAEVARCFQGTDVVLAPYQYHVGMSGILIHAAAAQKPVIASNYGLLGELVRQYQLGLAVDSTVPMEIAAAIQHCLSQSPTQLGDHQQMAIFAQKNSAQAFAETIFNTMRRCSASPPGA